jgi:hypothetical protein
MLSSHWTFFVKYIVGPLWIVLFAVPALMLAANPSAFDPPPPPEVRWIFPAIWIIAGAGILRFNMPLKRVEMRNGRLYVSNFMREWEIMPRDIESVRQRRWVNARPVRVRLRHEIDGLGAGFTFIPPTRFRLRLWREDPQVDELRRFAETVHTLPVGPM